MAAAGLIVFVLLMGCATSQPSESATTPTKDPGGTLEGTSWTCMTYTVGGTPQTVPVESTITAEFSAEGELTGNAGVNSYSTTFETDGGNLTIGDEIVTTKMAGPESVMKQESDYLTTLKTVESYQIDDKNGQLVLFGPAQNNIARYTPAQ